MWLIDVHRLDGETFQCTISIKAEKHRSYQLFLTTVTLNSPSRLTNLWSSDSRSNWTLIVLVFEERGKLENSEKNLSEKGRELNQRQQTQPTYNAKSRNGGK